MFQIILSCATFVPHKRDLIGLNLSGTVCKANVKAKVTYESSFITGREAISLRKRSREKALCLSFKTAFKDDETITRESVWPLRPGTRAESI